LARCTRKAQAVSEVTPFWVFFSEEGGAGGGFLKKGGGGGALAPPLFAKTKN